MFNRKSIKIAPDDDTASTNAATEVVGKVADKTDDASPQEPAALVVFGRDDGGKAHASRFGESDQGAAIKAAHLMGFQALAVEQPAVRDIADGLPEGRVFESGKGFVPFVKSGHCIALEAHAKQFPADVRALSADQIKALEAETASQADEGAGGEGSGGPVSGSGAADATTNTIASEAHTPVDWTDFEVGSRVLAVDDPEDGWWEAVVTDVHTSGIKGNMITMLTLHWALWPDEPAIVRKATDVALFHPTGVNSEGGADQAPSDTGDEGDAKPVAPSDGGATKQTAAATGPVTNSRKADSAPSGNAPDKSTQARQASSKGEV